MIKVLHIVPNMNAGGLETFIMNIYRNIDKNKIQFEFLEHYREESFYDNEIKSLGGKIYHFSLRNDDNIFKYIKDLISFFNNHRDFQAIHCHMESIGALVFIIARFYGIKIRIGHAHTNSVSNNFKGYIKRFTSLFFKYTTTINLACSESAGNYLFKSRKFLVVPNGIDFKKFEFSQENRNNLRLKYNLKNDFVIGHVGRMDDAKNQLFLVDVFNKYLKYNDKAKLILVGDGEYKSKIQTRIKKYGIENNVLLLGVKSNINELLSAFDLFAFPSKFEGLGIALIEAQINGLKTLTSIDIPSNTKISNYIKYLPLNEEDWVSEIRKVSKRDNNIVYNENKNNFKIETVVDKLLKIYEGV